MEPIKCSKCGNNNPPEANFCLSCGSPLPSASLKQPQTAIDEIRRLRGLVALINNRLDALEGKQKPTAPALSIPLITPVEPEPPKPAAKASPVTPEIKPPPEDKPVIHKTREWEQMLGGNWLARIGVLALIIGIGFFLKYAFDNNWIGPTARVILGVVAGLVMLGLGYWWRNRYPILTQVLSGGGIAVLYLSIFASFATYNLIGLTLAVVLLLIVSAISAVLARRYDSLALAILGIIGAFFAPYILGAFGDKGTSGSGTGEPIQLLVYIIVIDLGVLLLSTFRNWRWFTLLSLGCSLITYGFWYNEFHDKISIATSEIGITAIFIIFIGATSLFHIILRRIAQAFDYVLMVLTAAAYFGISLGLMWGTFRAWMGGFVLLLALFYGLFSYLFHKRSNQNTGLSYFSLAIAIIFLTIAIPIQFRDHATTTIAWAVEMVALSWVAFVVKLPRLRYMGYAVFATMFWRMLLFDTTVNINGFRPVLNERFLAYFIGITAIYFSVYLLKQKREAIPEWNPVALFILIVANLLTLWLISFEIWDSFSVAIRSAGSTAKEGLGNAQNLSLTAVWAVYAVAGLIIGIKKHWRYVRLCALALLAVPIIKVFAYDVFKLETTYRIVAFVGLGLLLLISAYLYQRYSKIIKGVFKE